jgi:hypothetical protein
MSVPTVIAVVGGIALLIGIFGGGVKAKEVEIPSINTRARVVSVIIGTVLLAAAALLSSPGILPVAPAVPTEIQPTQSFVSPPRQLTPSDYGPLLYEDNFDNDAAVWSLQKGSRIQNGLLALSPGESTIPTWTEKYSNYVFETSFQFANVLPADYSGMSVYLRYDPQRGGLGSPGVQ